MVKDFCIVGENKKLTEENKKLKEENKKLKEENEKLKPSKSDDKPDCIEIEKINKVVVSKAQQKTIDKIEQDKIAFFARELDIDTRDYWDKKDFKHGDIVYSESCTGLKYNIYKLISETKTQFRVSKLECCVEQNPIYNAKEFKAELRGYGWGVGTGGEIKWNANWKDGKRARITKKKLEKEFFVVDKRNLTFQDSNNTVIL